MNLGLINITNKRDKTSNRGIDNVWVDNYMIAMKDLSLYYIINE